MEHDLTLEIASGSEESALTKQIYIGHFPAFGAERDKFCKTNVRFFDGKLFHRIFDARVCLSNELSIGGREVILEKGEELWIVTRYTEKSVVNRLAHTDTPNVELSGPRAPAATKSDAASRGSA